MSQDMPPDFDAIPLFDLQQFNSGDLDRRFQFIKRLREACHHVGFFYIYNYGIDSILIEKMLNYTKSFFDLPQPEKETLAILNSPHYRGYGRLGAEYTRGLSDYKETFDLGLEQSVRDWSSSQKYLILQGPNQWPKESHPGIVGFQETMLEYMSAMFKVGETLMRALSLTLGLPEAYFVSQFCHASPDAYALLRLLRYPPVSTGFHQKNTLFGVGPHTDAGCLVLLLQDEAGGLQVQNCNGDWIDAPPIKNTLVVNIGEMLQIWSNNYFLATPHRVLNQSLKTRYSIPFFLEPHLSTTVSPLDIHVEYSGEVHRERLNSNTRVVYGEHMLNVYQRSF